MLPAWQLPEASEPDVGVVHQVQLLDVEAHSEHEAPLRAAGAAGAGRRAGGQGGTHRRAGRAREVAGKKQTGARKASHWASGRRARPAAAAPTSPGLRTPRWGGEAG